MGELKAEGAPLVEGGFAFMRLSWSMVGQSSTTGAAQLLLLLLLLLALIELVLLLVLAERVKESVKQQVLSVPSAAVKAATGCPKCGRLSLAE